MSKKITIIGIMEFEEMYPEVPKAFDISWEEGVKVFKKILNQHPEYYYYARPKEDFFIHEGVELAKENNASILITEDMS